MEYVSDNKLDSVRMWPAIPIKAVPQVLSSAVVGILCLHDNPIYRYRVNFNKVYDYMVAELPIVYSAKVKNNIIKSSKAGIAVPPGNPLEIGSALQKFRSMTTEERVLIAKRGRRVIAENYDISDLAERYLETIS